MSAKEIEPELLAELDKRYKNVDINDPEFGKQIMNHLETCDSGDCELSKYKNDLETQAFILGYLTRKGTHG